MLFRDRREAGQKLAQVLLPYREEKPVVIGLPRGGVVVAYEVARALNAPLDVIVARKLGAPGQPELGIGAIAPGGVVLIDPYTVRLLGLTEEDIQQLIEEETKELQRRINRYRGEQPFPDVTGKTVILVDDGLATGVTARAAIRALRKLNPARIILAVPVCAPDTARLLEQEADEVICLAAPPDFRAVGLWYQDFSQTTDEEVIDLLQKARTFTDSSL